MKNLMGAYRPHPRVQLTMPEGEKILTKQSFANETEINNIMARYVKTGLLDHLNTYQGDYGDFIPFADYHTSMNRIRDAGAAFMTLPAATRAKFANDPATFLEFVQDPENYDEMVKMGLAHEIPVDPDATPVVTPPPVVHETPEIPAASPA